MSYLESGSHRKFEHLYLDVKTDARSTTGKALSQSEMVEALISFAVEELGDDNSRLVEIAERIIENRQK
jgi:hypothetical protein